MLIDTAECLLEAAKAAWASTGATVPASAHVTAGLTVYDDCCPDGLLLLTIDQLAWFNPFPTDQNAGFGVTPPTPCRGTIGAYATLHIGLCVPVLDAQGRAPDPAAEQLARLAVVDLVEAMMTALSCPASDCWVMGGGGFAPSEGGCLIAQVGFRLDGRCSPCP